MQIRHLDVVLHILLYFLGNLLINAAGISSESMHISRSLSRQHALPTPGSPDKAHSPVRHRWLPRQGALPQNAREDTAHSPKMAFAKTKTYICGKMNRTYGSADAARIIRTELSADAHTARLIFCSREVIQTSFRAYGKIHSRFVLVEWNGTAAKPCAHSASTYSTRCVQSDRAR